MFLYKSRGDALLFK